MLLSRKIALAGVAAAMVATPTLAQAASTSLASTALGKDTTLPLLASPTDSLLLPLGGELLPSLAFDSRDLDAVLAPTAAQLAAARSLGASVTWNRTGTPRVIERTDGGSLSRPSGEEPVALARGWLTEHTDVLGLAPADIAALEVVRDHELPGIHARVVSFAQTFDGVASGYGAILTVVIDRKGRVVRYAGDPVRATDLLGSFELSAAQALQQTVRSLSPDLAAWTAVPTGETQGGYQVFKAGSLVSTQWVRRIAFPTAAGARAAYATLVVKSMNEAYAVIVDAETGRPLLRKSLVQHSEGTIYENYPAAAKGGKPKVVSFDATRTSPGGYVDPTGAAGIPGPTTIGNNANAAIAWTVPLVALD